MCWKSLHELTRENHTPICFFFSFQKQHEHILCTFSCSMSTPIVVVIGGASAGLGRGIALNLASHPHAKTGARFHLVLLARREAELQAVVDECNKASGGNTASYFVADLTSRDETFAAADFALKTFGRIDVWINNAGRSIYKHTLDLTPQDIENMMSVNVYSALYGTQAAVKAFTDHKIGGQIIMVSSALPRFPAMFPQGAAYGASKAFLNAITDTLRVDLKANEATKDVVVTLFSPGAIDTDFGKNSGFGDLANPYARPVDEVSVCVRTAIEERVEELYSSPELKKVCVDYLQAKA